MMALTVVSRAVSSNGLSMCPSKPAASLFARPEIAITGGCGDVVMRCSFRRNSYPSMRGIRRSHNTMSKARRHLSSASRPSAAPWTSAPSRSSVTRVASRASSMSSTTRMRSPRSSASSAVGSGVRAADACASTARGKANRRLRAATEAFAGNADRTSVSLR